MQDNEQDQIQHYLDERKKQEEKGEEHTQQQKQKIKFIKQHIVDHYKGDQEIEQLFAQYFLKYLLEKKGIKTQQHNLRLLSLEQLEEIVKTFQTLNPLQIIQQKRRSLIEDSVSISVNLESLQQHEVMVKGWNPKKVYYTNGSWDYELNGYAECKKEKAYFSQSNLKAKNVEIVFNKFQTKKSGGFFGIGSSLELWIQMKSVIIKGTISRTAQDFMFLREALKLAVPFTFIPPLDLNESMLKKVDNEQVKATILKECHKFINNLCKNEELLQNFYTFRFFTEIKYQNYVIHKKTIKQLLINHTKLLKNRQGCVQIQISDRNELLKKDYGRKGQYLQKIWRFVGQSNSRIVQKLKEIESQIACQKKQFQAIIKDIANSNQILQSPCYEKLSDVLLCYNDVYKVYQENISHIQQFFRSVSSKLAQQSQKHWKTFINYKTEVFQYSTEYQAKRKAFLQKGQQKLKEPSKVGTTKGEQPANKQKPTMSFISELGIDDASERELAWVERYSKWQAYINRKFVKGFEDLVASDREKLKEIMQKTAQKTLQFRGKQEMSFIAHLSVISE